MSEASGQRAITYLVYEDLEGMREYLVRALGLEAGPVSRDESGTVVHAEVSAGDTVIWLHRTAPEHGLASPRAVGTATAGVAVFVEDVDAHHRRAAEEGAAVEGAPVDQPYGYREYSVRDPEGTLWSFMAPLAVKTG